MLEARAGGGGGVKAISHVAPPIRKNEASPREAFAQEKATAKRGIIVKGGGGGVYTLFQGVGWLWVGGMSVRMPYVVV